MGWNLEIWGLVSAVKAIISELQNESWVTSNECGVDWSENNISQLPSKDARSNDIPSVPV